MINEEYAHSSHPGHQLKLVHEKAPYTCNGCHETGFGNRYKCGRPHNPCTFHLHKYCAFPERAITHAFFPGCIFLFLEKPPTPGTYSCNACGRDIEGYNYHCSEKGHDLHPTCALLAETLTLYEGALTLKLKQKTPSKCYHCGKEEASVCKCGAKRTSWSYVSTCEGKRVLHVACVKNMLLEHWKRGCPGGEVSSDAKSLVMRAPIVPQKGEGWESKVIGKVVETVVKIVIHGIFAGG